MGGVGEGEWKEGGHEGRELRRPRPERLLGDFSRFYPAQSYHKYASSPPVHKRTRQCCAQSLRKLVGKPRMTSLGVDLEFAD